MPTCTHRFKNLCGCVAAADPGQDQDTPADAPRAFADRAQELVALATAEIRGPNKRARRRAATAVIAALARAEPAPPPVPDKNGRVPLPLETGRIPPHAPKPKPKAPGAPRTPWAEPQRQAAAARARPGALREQIMAALRDQERREKLRAQLRHDLCKKSFAFYCRAAWHVIEPSTRLQWGRHHQLIADTLQGLFEDWLRTKREDGYQNKIRKAVFNLPPGSLKSRVIAVFFPTWAWLHEPGWKVICLSINEKAAQRDAMTARDLIKSDWYQGTFKPTWSLRADKDAVGDYWNTASGGRISQAAGSEIVGLRGDCVAGETLVATEHGDVPIAELHAAAGRGERLPRVWAMNHATTGAGDGQELREIQATRKIENRAVRSIGVVGRRRLTCTDDHRIWRADAGDYVPAATLEPGHALTTIANCTAVIDDVRAEPGAVDVYDIQVEGLHNFFANGILVHNCVLIDDANNPKDAENKNERDAVNTLWSTNTSTRVNSVLCSLFIGVQQRTNALDWTGFVLETDGVWSLTNLDGWLHVVLPAEFEIARKFVAPECLRGPWTIEYQDWRTAEGESIDPARMPPRHLESKRREWAGTSNYAGQYQQSPTDAGGGVLKRIYWGFFRLERGIRDAIDEVVADIENRRPRPEGCVADGPGAEPAVVGARQWVPGEYDFDWICISVDPASKKTERGSNYGILVMGGRGTRYYVLADHTRRGGFLEISSLIRDLVILWKPDKILIEDKAAGPNVVEELNRLMDDEECPVTVIESIEPGNAGKEERLDGCIRVFASGRVYLLDGATWLEEFVKECGLFPSGAHDDRVDAITQCINHMRLNETQYPLD